MKKSPEEIDLEEKLNNSAKKLFPFLTDRTECNGGNWLLKDGSLLNVIEHSDIKSAIKDVIGEEKTLPLLNTDWRVERRKVINYFQKNANAIRVRCERSSMGERNINIEMNTSQPNFSQHQESRIKDLMCSGNFNNVYLDLVEPSDRKILWDSNEDEQRYERREEGKSKKYFIDLDNCDNIGDRVFRDTENYTRTEEIKEIPK